MIPTAFKTLPLETSLLRNLASLGYSGMTPIQAHSLPLILAGSDVMAQAKTGSGKTAAFGIGLLARMLKPASVDVVKFVCHAGLALEYSSGQKSYNAI